MPSAAPESDRPAEGAASTAAPTHPDFDPCSSAKVTSPFYLYNHDSPRPSMENKRPPVVVHDIEGEAGTGSPSPSITQEKHDAHTARSGRFRFWARQKPCMTKPKPRHCTCLAHLPPKQRLAVKILIAVAIVGAMVGIAVGISIRVGGGVYKNNNSTRPIG